MYTYLCQYPKDREMGWSDEIQGVCHDKENWYFTQNGNIWKFPLSYDLNNTCKSENRSIGIYKNAYGHRLGDIDYYNGYLFVPVTGDGNPYIAAFRASDLSYVAKTELLKFKLNYSSLHWCAINPNDGYLYTSDKNVGNDFTKETTPVMVYRIDFDRLNKKQDYFIYYKTFLRIYNASGDRLRREYVQGGCFDDKNHLHINNGRFTLKVVDHNYANDRGGISVFSVPSIPEKGFKRSYRVKRIAASNQKDGFRYQFNGTGEEPSGITYWDLRNEKPGGKVCGCLHAIMSDNTGKGADDFYFKHYDRLPVVDEKMSQHVSKMGVIITSELCNKREILKDKVLNTVVDAIVSSDEEKRRRKNQDLMAGLFKNRKIEYTVIENMTSMGIEAILYALFEESVSTDVNYIYINCHGNKDELLIGYYDISKEIEMKYTHLHAVLSEINGKKVVLIDSCHSGNEELLDEKTHILASSLTDENATGDSVIGNWATRYWVCGAGYDFLPGAKDDLEADSDKDHKVTLRELRDYTNRKLRNNSRLQHCVAISHNLDEVIFEK